MSRDATNDLTLIWQSQAIEEPEVSFEGLQERARKFGGKLQRVRVIFAVALAIHILCHVLRQVVQQPEFTGWIGVIEALSLVVLAFYWPDRQAGKEEWPVSIMPQLGSASGFDFYRRQLERQREWLGENEIKATIALVVLVGIHLPRYPALIVPLSVLFAVAGVVLFMQRRIERAAVQRELDELRGYLRSQ